MPDPSALDDELRARYQYQELESRTYLGREAKGMEMVAMGMRFRAWIWENIPLYMETFLSEGEPMVTEVTSLEWDVPVAEDRFSVPEGVTLTEEGVAQGQG